MRKLLIVLLSIGLFTCVGCAKEEQEVELPVQKVPVVKQVPVAPDIQEVNKKQEKKEIKTGNRKVDDFINGEADWDTKPVKSTGFK